MRSRSLIRRTKRGKQAIPGHFDIYKVCRGDAVPLKEPQWSCDIFFMVTDEALKVLRFPGYTPFVRAEEFQFWQYLTRLAHGASNPTAPDSAARREDYLVRTTTYFNDKLPTVHACRYL
jgi:hypothetical protein